jgi:two-component system sensor histidine kinase KdpD
VTLLAYALPPVDEKAHTWQRYLFDSLLAFAGSLFITGVIAIFRLYPRIPNISIVYLLVVLALATTRGRYAAIFASGTAFLSFDFFIVPPLYTFVMYHVEEWIALFVFLIDAVLTGHLASALHQQAQQASRREYETHMLYDLVRETNRVEAPAKQLHVIAKAIVDAFSSWGIQDCAILQPDRDGGLRPQTSAYQPLEEIKLTSDEHTSAIWVMKHGRSMSMYDDASSTLSSSSSSLLRVLVQRTSAGHIMRRTLRLVPLKVGQQVVGVLRLLYDSRHWQQEGWENEEQPAEMHTSFFWNFLDQATTLIESARLRSENLRIEVLQRTDALRAALLSSVSHDLRTPLTVIKAAASSLQQEDVQWGAEERHSFARSIEREADRLNRLVSNLLDMSRIEEGALKPDTDLYPLTALVQDVLDRLQPLLQGREVTLHLAQDLPPIELDYLHIDQVITNLVENAVHYTPPGSPLEVSAQRDGQQVLLSIADRGPGIPPDQLEHIFDKFYRVLNDQRGRPFEGYPPGSGLGLAVCRGLVEAHGGTIWAQPREGGGVTFFVAFPVPILEGRQQ